MTSDETMMLTLLRGVLRCNCSNNNGDFRILGGDVEILEALYRSTGGTGWKFSTNWLSAEHISTWWGVTADFEGRVTKLRLGNNGLAGKWLGVVCA